MGRVSFRFLLLLCCAFAAWTQLLPFIPVTGPKELGALLIDRQGGLWVGAVEGAYVSDGLTTLPLRSAGLPSIGVHCFAEDEEGGIWIGFQGTLYRIHSGKVQHIYDGVVTSLVPINRDLILAIIGPAGRGIPDVAPLYLIKRQSNTWKVSPIEGITATGVASLDHAGQVLFACGSGWCEMNAHEAARPHPSVTRHGLLSFLPIRVLRDRFGCVWFRNETSAAYQCPGQPFTPLPREIAFMNAMSQIRENRDGSMLLVSTTALAMGRPGSFQLTGLDNGLPTGLVDGLQADDGTIWLAGDPGLFRFPSPFRIQYWGHTEGITDPSAITRLGGDMFVGSNQGIARLSLKDDRWQTITRMPLSVRGLMPASSRSLYAALTNGLLSEIDTHGVELRRADPPVGAGNVLARTPDGQVWLAGPGILKINVKGQKLIPQTVLPGQERFGQGLLTDPQGRLWACYSGGLAYQSGGEWRTVTTEQGLRQNKCRAITLDSDNDVWYGYNTVKEFARVEFRANGTASVHNFADSDKGGTGEVHFFNTDHRGWLWRGSRDGVYVATPSEAHQGRWLRLNEADGLPDAMMNQRTFFADDDGSV